MNLKKNTSCCLSIFRPTSVIFKIHVTRFCTVMCETQSGFGFRVRIREFRFEKLGFAHHWFCTMLESTCIATGLSCLIPELLQNINHFLSTAKQGDNALGSVRPPVQPSVRVPSHGWTVQGQGQMYGAQRSILGARLCRVQQRASTTITSLRSLSVSVIRGRLRIVAWMRSIGF